MITKTIKLYTNYHKALIWFLVVSIVFLACLYGFFVNSSVLMTAERQDIEFESGLVSNSLSLLESQYLNVIGAINKDAAYSIGFIETENRVFASRKSSVATALSSGF